MRNGIPPLSSGSRNKAEIEYQRNGRQPSWWRVVSPSLTWKPGQWAELWKLLYPPSVIELSLGWAANCQVYGIAACMPFTGTGKEKFSVQLQAAMWSLEQLCQCHIELVAIKLGKSKQWVCETPVFGKPCHRSSVWRSEISTHVSSLFLSVHQHEEQLPISIAEKPVPSPLCYNPGLCRTHSYKERLPNICSLILGLVLKLVSIFCKKNKKTYPAIFIEKSASEAICLILKDMYWPHFLPPSYSLFFSQPLSCYIFQVPVPDYRYASVTLD